MVKILAADDHRFGVAAKVFLVTLNASLRGHAGMETMSGGSGLLDFPMTIQTLCPADFRSYFMTAGAVCHSFQTAVRP
jgi:hypothetical protein